MKRRKENRMKRAVGKIDQLLHFVGRITQLAAGRSWSQLVAANLAPPLSIGILTIAKVWRNVEMIN
jgi:hypothetical protein